MIYSAGSFRVTDNATAFIIGLAVVAIILVVVIIMHYNSAVAGKKARTDFNGSTIGSFTSSCHM